MSKLINVALSEKEYEENQKQRESKNVNTNVEEDIESYYTTCEETLEMCKLKTNDKKYENYINNNNREEKLMIIDTDIVAKKYEVKSFYINEEDEYESKEVFEDMSEDMIERFIRELKKDALIYIPITIRRSSY